MKNTLLYQAMLKAWDLFCDFSLPKFATGNDNSENDDWERPNQIAAITFYTFPVWGAIIGALAMILACFLGKLLPTVGGAVVFALICTYFSEKRTSSRALAMNVSMAEPLLAGEDPATAWYKRQSSIRHLTGPYVNLLAIGLLTLKFFAFFRCFYNGNPGFVTAAAVLALSAEALLALMPESSAAGSYFKQCASSGVMAIAGFWLLFNLTALPLATLVASGGTAAIVLLGRGLLVKRNARIEADDITQVSYLVELFVLTTALLLLK